MYKMKGYNKLATLMAPDPGMFIFRHFASLNAKNLLYLQAEIVLLADELNFIINRDQISQNEQVSNFSTSVWYLKEYFNPPPVQWEKVLELRRLLNEYNTALIQQSQLLRFKPPHPHDLRTFKKWQRREGGGSLVCSTAIEQAQWGEYDDGSENERDLISLSGRYENVDHLTRWMFGLIIPLFHRCFGERVKTVDAEMGVYHYRDDQIIRGTRILSTFLSSVFPASSMVVLYVLDSMIARLIVIIVYNVLFSILVGLMTRARRVEIFAASVAFAAVQVAFITNLSS